MSIGILLFLLLFPAPYFILSDLLVSFICVVCVVLSGGKNIHGKEENFELKKMRKSRKHVRQESRHFKWNERRDKEREGERQKRIKKR